MDLNFINFLHPGLWIKIITLILIGFYVIFTFVVYTQVKTMSKILHFPHAEVLFKTISIIHIALAFSLFLVAFAIL